MVCLDWVNWGGIWKKSKNLERGNCQFLVWEIKWENFKFVGGIIAGIWGS